VLSNGLFEGLFDSSQPQECNTALPAKIVYVPLGPAPARFLWCQFRARIQIYFRRAPGVHDVRDRPRDGLGLAGRDGTGGGHIERHWANGDGMQDL
jgi:hypothetical protein